MHITSIQRCSDRGSIEFEIENNEKNFRVRFGGQVSSEGLILLEIDALPVRSGSDEAKQVLAALNIWWKSLSQVWSVKSPTPELVHNCLDTETLKAVNISRLLVVKNYIECHYIRAA